MFVLCTFGDRWHVCAVDGLLNALLVMMDAILVGFVLGIDGMRDFAHETVSNSVGLSSRFQRAVSGTTTNRYVHVQGGIHFLLGGCKLLLVDVWLMFEYRQ
jgi:hypothetical protein